MGNIAILGAGISGLSIAQMLKGRHNVVLFEKKSTIGGLIHCERVNDSLFHKVGGHVFNAKNKEVFDWFWSFFDIDTEFIKAKRKAKILYNDNIIGYPIENYLYMLPKDIITKVIDELYLLQVHADKSLFDYPDFESFLKGNFGNTLYREYFQPYNQKIWNVDLATIPMEWLDGKLPMPNFKEMILRNIIKEEEETMVHSNFYYPKNDGSQFIANRLSEGLDIRCSCNEADISIDENHKIRIGGEVFDKLIYTGDVRKISEAMKSLIDDNQIIGDLLKLRSNGTSNLFCETDEVDISWLYIPQDFTKAHRIIYTGNFSDTNNRGSKRKTCVVEFSGQVSVEDMYKEIEKLPGNLSPIKHNYEANSYIVQDKTTRELITKTKTILESQNIFLLGRFAEWEYYNMDKAIEAALLLNKKIN